MAEEELNDSGAEEQTESQEVESLSREEVDKLLNERLEKERKEWQSRFDKLRNEKTEAEKKLEDNEKSWQQRLQEEVSSVKQELENYKSEAQRERLRSQAIKHVSSAGLELDDVEEKLVFRLIDPSAEDPLADVDAYIEREKQKAEKIKLSAADEFAKKNGRKVEGGKSGGPTTYEDLKGMSREEIEALPTETLDKILGNKE